MSRRREFSAKVKVAAFERCSVHGCNRDGRGHADNIIVCATHYQRWKKYGSFDLPDRAKSPNGFCVALDCGKPIRSKYAAFCETHYYRILRGSAAGLGPILEACLQCSAPLSRNQSKFCSLNCCTRFSRGTPEVKSCIICGLNFTHPGTVSVTFSDTCRMALEGLWRARYQQSPTFREMTRAREYRRRAQKVSAPSEEFIREEIFKRDSWRCQICFKSVNRKVKWPHPHFPTLDHITPIARGGAHVRANVQCAHLICNIKKNDGPGGQLRLFG